MLKECKNIIMLHIEIFYESLSTNRRSADVSVIKIHDGFANTYNIVSEPFSAWCPIKCCTYLQHLDWLVDYLDS